MNHAPSKVISELLVISGRATNPAPNVTWPVYQTTIPDHSSVPDDVLSVMDTAALRETRLMNGEVILRPGIQVLVRGRTYQEARAKAESVSQLFNLVVNFTIPIEEESYKITSIQTSGDILVLGQEQDTKKRWLLSVNATLSMVSRISELYLPESQELLGIYLYDSQAFIDSANELNTLINNDLP